LNVLFTEQHLSFTVCSLERTNAAAALIAKSEYDPAICSGSQGVPTNPMKRALYVSRARVQVAVLGHHCHSVNLLLLLFSSLCFHFFYRRVHQNSTPLILSNLLIVGYFQAEGLAPLNRLNVSGISAAALLIDLAVSFQEATLAAS
jgi:hypothetical protein